MSELEQKAISDISKAIALALKSSEDEWEKATSPMKTDITSKSQTYEKYISKPSKNPQAKPMEKFATGTMLDNLFYNEKHEPLGGIPFGAQFGILGLADSGKSILVQEIALQTAHNGKQVLFITNEDVWSVDSPRMDLENRMKQKAKILGLDWKKIMENLTVLDTITFSELRDWSLFAEVYRHVCETKQIDLVIIDSLTLLEAYRGAIKYRLLEMIRFNTTRGITALYICQRSKPEWDSYEIAGNIGVAHNLDGIIVVDFGKAWNNVVTSDLNVKRGTFVRILRIFGSRLGAFDRRYHEITITDDGLLRLAEPQQS